MVVNIAIPLDEDMTLCEVKEATHWSLSVLENSNIKESKRYKTYEDIEEIVDFVVVKDKSEDVDDFLDDGANVLIAPFQKSVEDILEAYMFRELYQL